MAEECSARSSLSLFVIERNIPMIQIQNRQYLKDLACTSNNMIDTLKEKNDEKIEWRHSYICDDKVFCLYQANSEEIILEHSKLCEFPCDKITKVETNLMCVQDNDSKCKFFIEMHPPTNKEDLSSAIKNENTDVPPLPKQPYGHCVAKFFGENTSFCVLNACSQESFKSDFSDPVLEATIYPVHAIISPSTASDDMELVEKVTHKNNIQDGF